jgi:hypothetical protein
VFMMHIGAVKVIDFRIVLASGILAAPKGGGGPGNGWVQRIGSLQRSEMTYTFKIARRLAVCLLLCATATLLVTLGVIIGRASVTPPSGTLAWMLLIVGDAWETLGQVTPPNLIYYPLVAFGSLIGRIFSLQGDFGGSLPFLTQALPGRAPAYYHWLDLILSSVVGTVVGIVVINPDMAITALATGLGWPLLLRALVGGLKAVLPTGTGSGSG